MWMTHGNGYSVLVQHTESLELRAAHFPKPDDAIRESLRDLPEPEAEAKWAAYLGTLVDPPVVPPERVVLWSEGVGAVINHESHNGPSRLPCPRCRGTLDWEHTGIS
jgi:hypothetical protein